MNRYTLVGASLLSTLVQIGSADAQEVNSPLLAAAGPRQLRVDVNPTFAGDQVAHRRSPAGNFDVDVRILNLTPATSCASFILYYDPLVVSFVGLQGNALLGSDPNPSVFNDPLAGTVTVFMEVGTADPCPLPGVSGTGLLARLRFMNVDPVGQTGFDVMPTGAAWQGPPMCTTAIPGQDYTIAKGVVVFGGNSISCLNINTTLDDPWIHPTAGNPDCNPALGVGDISLRSAIQVANAVSGGNHPTVRIPAMNPTILVGPPLPALSDGTGGTFIDGTTQPLGIAHVEGPGAAPEGGAALFSLTAPENTLKQLGIIGNAAGPGVDILNSNNKVFNCLVGIDALNAPAGNFKGIEIGAGTGSSIGNNGGGNVISSNLTYGVIISGGSGNTVSGNRIGTDSTGNLDRGNALAGVYINGTPNNVIGGSGMAGNQISGNNADGIEIAGAGATGNTVQGNLIGTNAVGAAALPNSVAGIYLNNAPSNTIGGSTALVRNVISGNLADGIEIFGATSSNNVVKGNYIGTALSGAAAVPNVMAGIYINAADGNTIGGAAAADGNVISGNGTPAGIGHGVQISLGASTNNELSNNLIGLNAAGTAAVANLADGVRIDFGAHDNIVGTGGEGNTISGNGDDGLDIRGAGTNANLARGNRIGTNLAGTSPVPNVDNGAELSLAAKFNVVGGSFSSDANIIGGHAGVGDDGVLITGAGTDDNRVEMNRIGTNFVQTDLGNSNGVTIENGAKFNEIVQNTIVANDSDGVRVNGVGTNQNEIIDNFIGDASLPNFHGIHVSGKAQLNLLSKNAVGNNSSHGIVIGDDETDGNILTANAVLGNEAAGILIELDAAFTMIGGSEVSANLIDGNLEEGIRIESDASDSDIVRNTLRFNGLGGVIVESGLRNLISQNSIHDNQYLAGPNGLGIDLNDDGVTPNDAGDGDGGANAGQNYPVLATAVGNTVTGTLQGAPSAAYTIEFFANDSCDPSGFGEGQAYLGSGTATTDEDGDDVFTIMLASAPPPRSLVTATATDALGNTSEFSACIEPTVIAFCPPDIAPPGGDGVVDVDDLLALIGAWGACADPDNCPADLAPPGGDDAVDVDDLLALISAWGPCP